MLDSLEPFHESLYIAIGKPGLEINCLRIHVAESWQHVATKPGTTVITERCEVIARVFEQPLLQLWIRRRRHPALGAIHIAEQQVKASLQWHEIQLGKRQGIKTLTRFIQPLRFATRKA